MEKCCICNKYQKENLEILGKPICSECEWKILTAQAHTKGYINCVKKLNLMLGKSLKIE